MHLVCIRARPTVSAARHHLLQLFASRVSNDVQQRSAGANAGPQTDNAAKLIVQLAVTDSYDNWISLSPT